MITPVKKTFISVKLQDVRPNPYRDLEHFPLVEERIVNLVRIFERDGFADALPARKRSDGGYEIAWGHHRIEALRRLNKEEVDLAVVDYTDPQMLRLLFGDNSEEFKHNSALESIQLVDGAVKALAAGQLPEALVTTENTRVDAFRYAPHYSRGSVPKAEGRRWVFTQESLARALVCVTKDGKANVHVRAGLLALELQEKYGDIEQNPAYKNHRRRSIYELASTLNSSTALEKACSDLLERLKSKAAQSREETMLSARVDAEQRQRQTTQKEKEKKEYDARQVLLKKLADDRRDEDDQKAEELRSRLEAQEEVRKLREETRGPKLKALNEKVEQNKKREAERRKVDMYAPIRHEVERILHKLDGSIASTDAALTEEVKALVRQNLNLADRDRLWQAALTRGTFYTEWIAVQFLLPLTPKRPRVSGLGRKPKQ